MATQSVNGVQMHYQEAGDGPLLILLHGFPLDSRMWEAQIGELSSRWAVLAPDFPGFGKSTVGGQFSVPSLADDIHDFAGPRKYVLAGLSMGGYVAMNLARKYPDDLLGLILLDTKDAGDTPEQRDNRNRMIEVVRAKGSAAIAEMMLGKMVSPDTLAHRPAQVQALRSMMEACPAQTIEYALVALRDRPDMTEELPKISVPTLIVVGDADAITPLDVAEGMQKKIPGSQLEIIRGAGHMSPMEQSSQVNRVMGKFLKEIVRGGNRSGPLSPVLGREE